MLYEETNPWMLRGCSDADGVSSVRNSAASSRTCAVKETGDSSISVNEVIIGGKSPKRYI